MYSQGKSHRTENRKTKWKSMYRHAKVHNSRTFTARLKTAKRRWGDPFLRVLTSLRWKNYRFSHSGFTNEKSMSPNLTLLWSHQATSLSHVNTQKWGFQLPSCFSGNAQPITNRHLRKINRLKHNNRSGRRQFRWNEQRKKNRFFSVNIYSER